MEGSSIGLCFLKAGVAKSEEAAVPVVAAGVEAPEAEIEDALEGEVVVEEETPADVGVDGETDKDAA